MKAKQLKSGVCSLTGEYGPFVKCHILPQSLTSPEPAGSALWQSSNGNGLTRRWTSWYDQALVTRRGEDILARIDDVAISALRRHKLVWSSWDQPPAFEDFGAAEQGWTIRQVQLGQDGPALHRFVVSVIWRAAASRMADMQHLVLPDGLVSRAKNALVSDDPIPLDLFPTSLIQLSTKGKRHNHTPILDAKDEVRLDGKASKRQLFVRTFVDGLLFHSHLDATDFDLLEGNKLILGGSDTVAIAAVRFEKSSQRDRLLAAASGSRQL